MTPASSTSRIDGSKVKGLNCPGCGSALSVRGFEHTLTIVCPNCLSILDAKDPNFQVLRTFQSKTRFVPLIPLGSRGNWRGVVYEVIGYQRRAVRVEGIDYGWAEYLLFNPYKGFHYITEYDGHWNDVRTLRSLPKPGFALGRKPHMVSGGETFTHFSAYQARTTYVLGEFPWQVRVGETIAAKDYIDPPRILSSESTTAETVWSSGVYVSGAEIWQSFQLPGSPPKPRGVYLNQPSPYLVKSKELWRMCRYFLLAAVLLTVAGFMMAGDEQVFSQSYMYEPSTQQEASFVTPAFELKPPTTNVEISTTTSLYNNWAYFNYALINDETGQTYDFGREVSYYTGRDSDGTWTEGSTSDKVALPEVPPGRYYLRVEPELPKDAKSVGYTISVRHDVPTSAWFFIVAALLLVPPIWTTFKRFTFESTRWRESDYAPAGGD